MKNHSFCELKFSARTSKNWIGCRKKGISAHYDCPSVVAIVCAGKAWTTVANSAEIQAIGLAYAHECWPLGRPHTRKCQHRWLPGADDGLDRDISKIKAQSVVKLGRQEACSTKRSTACALANDTRLHTAFGGHRRAAIVQLTSGKMLRPSPAWVGSAPPQPLSL